MDMTLQHVAYWAEIVGVVAIVATLIYLAVELRQNTKSVRLSAVHDISSLYASVMLTTGGDKDNADVWIRGLHEYANLDQLEKARFLVFMGVSVRTLSDQFFQWQEGALDTQVWNGMRHVIDDLAQYEGFKVYWKLRSHQFSEGFQAYVDTALERVPTGRPLYG
jgi:hypothetical protein